jgi:hypothetical protein
MLVEKVRPRLWRWTLLHPDADTDGEYVYNQGLDKVACAAIVRRDTFVLIDPLAPAAGDDREKFWRAVDRDVEHHGTPHVVLTTSWRRSTAAVAERYPGTRVWVHTDAHPDGAEPTDSFSAGDELPGGLAVYDGYDRYPVLWSPEHRALIGGDPLVGATTDAGRLRSPTTWPEQQPRIAKVLAPLFELPVELVLPAHGDPVLTDGAAALRHALQA